MSARIIRPDFWKTRDRRMVQWVLDRAAAEFKKEFGPDQRDFYYAIASAADFLSDGDFWLIEKDSRDEPPPNGAAR
jgi:hypothetical protein